MIEELAKLLSRLEVAKLLGCSVGTVANLCKDDPTSNKESAMPKRSPLKPRRYQPTLDGRRCNISFGQIPDYLNAEYRKHLDDLVIE
ncbi:MAG: hypothetical protein ACRC46_00390, partial [Thermoguttaceae bacterium]